MLLPNGRISKRKTVQLGVALTILAWATQTLLHQWGFGGEIMPPTFGSLASPASAAPSQLIAAPADDVADRFVPANAASVGSTLEMRTEATIVGAEIKLKQVCRWCDADDASLSPLAELIVARITPGKPFKTISVNEIKSTLIDAHVNMAGINFVGPLSCTINRSDMPYDERVAMQQWIDARTVDAPDAATIAVTTARTEVATGGSSGSGSTSSAKPQAAEQAGVRTLRDLLAADVAERLNISADTIQMSFKPLDEKVLNLAEPLFRFQIEPTRVRNLGKVEWDVTVISGNGNKKFPIEATARAWANQALLTKPLAYKQLIQEGDLIEKRTLTDTLPDDPLVTKPQAVGQQAARELKPGTVLSSRMLDPVELVKSGQFVTITVSHGAVSIKTVARAMEGGSMGQTIKVKNETTRDIFDVVLTGPQTASLNADSPPARVVSLD